MMSVVYPGVPQEMKTEAVRTILTSMQAKKEDASDSPDITTQGYVEKYSWGINPTSFMQSGVVKRATLIVEYIIKTDPGTGTVSVKTLVDGADSVEKTGLTIGSGKQTDVHIDITDFSSSLTVSLEAKNSDSGQTSVIDYCNIYLQIGTKATTPIEVLRLTGIQSLSFIIHRITHGVWSGTGNTSSLKIRVDTNSGGEVLESASSQTSLDKDAVVACFIGVIDGYLVVFLNTNDATDPSVLGYLQYVRAWFE